MPGDRLESTWARVEASCFENAVTGGVKAALGSEPSLGGAASSSGALVGSSTGATVFGLSAVAGVLLVVSTSVGDSELRSVVPPNLRPSAVDHIAAVEQVPDSRASIDAVVAELRRRDAVSRSAESLRKQRPGPRRVGRVPAGLDPQPAVHPQLDFRHAQLERASDPQPQVTGRLSTPPARERAEQAARTQLQGRRASLAGELAGLEAARAALKQGRVAKACRILARLARKQPKGQLRLERSRLARVCSL